MTINDQQLERAGSNWVALDAGGTMTDAVNVVTVPDLDVLLPYERQHRLVIAPSCTARPGAGGQDLPHMPVDYSYCFRSPEDM